MKKTGPNKYQVDSSTERILMDVVVDQPPYLASFEDPPKPSKWENVKMTTPTSEHREFVGPATFEGSFDEALPDNGGIDRVTYTITFTGETGPAVKDTTVVPKGGGPILKTYLFSL
jgi:hypothetical protein